MKTIYDESILQELWELGFYPPEQSGDVTVLNVRQSYTYPLKDLSFLEGLVGRKLLQEKERSLYFRGKLC